MGVEKTEKGIYGAEADLQATVAHVRDRLVNGLLIFLVCFGLPAVVASLFRARDVGWHSIMYVQVGVYCLLVFAALMRHRLSYTLRAGGLLCLTFSLAVGGIVTWGLVGMGPCWFLVSSVLTTLLYGTRGGLVVMAASVCFMAMQGVANAFGYLLPQVDATSYAVAPSTWVMSVVGIGLFTGIPVVAAGRLFSALIEANERLTTRRAELQEANAQLEEVIAARAKAQKNLRLTQYTIDHAGEAAFWIREGGTITYVNDAACHTLGYTRRELLAMNIFEIDARIPIQEAPQIWDTLKKAGDVTFETFHRTKDGCEIPVEVTASYVTFEGEEQICVFARDITDRKEAEQALQRRERELSQAQRLAHMGSYRWDIRTGEMTWSDEFRELLARPDVAPSTELYVSIIYPEDRDSVFEATVRSCETSAPFSLEYRIVLPDGAVRYVNDQAEIEQEPEGVPLSMLGSVQDITERKNAEEELRRLAAVVEQAFEYVILTDTEGVIQYVNPAHERALGYTLQELAGELAFTLAKSEEDAVQLGQLLKAVARGNPWSGRLNLQCKDGGLVQVEATVSPIRDAVGEITGYLSIQRDITHEAELESQLRQAQKMEAIGNLAGGIAHDFNNILSGILGYSDMALSYLPEGSVAHRDIGQVVLAARRAGDLVRQILTFSRQTGAEKKRLLIGPVVKEGLKLLRSPLSAGTEICQEIDSDCPAVLGDPTQIHQVIMNMGTNAYYAMEGRGGILSVKLKAETVSPENAEDILELQPGKYVCLTIADTGRGMDAETAEHIFEPYFTTKPEGKGTGMGLATVHGIVRDHGGAIRVQSVPGEGTIMRVYLPALEESEEPGKDFPVTEELGNGQQVIIVDDEDPVLDVNRRILERLGYRVMAFRTPGDALEHVHNPAAVIDVIVTDQVMPKMDGITLAQECFTARPGVPVILLTGYGDEEALDRACKTGIREVVLKPATKGELARAIHEAVNQTTGE